jgi:chromatin assembly factor 1 subunit B
MTVTFCCGCLRRTRRRTPTLRRASKTRRHGGSRPCAGPSAPRSTTWPGPQTASSSSQAAWTTLPAYITPRQVHSNIQHLSPTSAHSVPGSIVRQIAEHNHYVQGVAWDPLNEFIATQSSDRSVHIYTLKNKDGQFSLAQHSKVAKMDLPARRVSSNSPAPPDFGGRASFVADANLTVGSPVPSMPGTPQSLALPTMHPPPTSHSRRSSFGSSPSMRRSASPAPSMPLPAVMPNSPSMNSIGTLGVRNAPIYFNETLTSFFRRLTFAPDGSLLFTPAGQYKAVHPSINEAKPTEDITNTVYIYTRAGLNKPPVAFLPGHKKPSVAVRCSPVYYTIRQNPLPTKQITIDTSHDDDMLALPEPIMPSKPPTSHSSMDPPPVTSAPSPSPSMTAPSPKPVDGENGVPAGPPPAFSLPYRMIYAVATQDAIHIYDTQQQGPLCIVSNLHFATFTDVTWYVCRFGAIILANLFSGRTTAPRY